MTATRGGPFAADALRLVPAAPSRPPAGQAPWPNAPRVRHVDKDAAGSVLRCKHRDNRWFAYVHWDDPLWRDGYYTVDVLTDVTPKTPGGTA